MIRHRVVVGVLLATAWLVMLPAAAGAAAPGQLDPSFGAGGSGVTTLLTGTALAGVAAAPGGTVVGVGAVGSSLLVARFSATGSLQSTFAAGSGVGQAVDVQPDGKIVVAGYDGAGMLVERFNANGSRDTRFGSGGIVHAVSRGRASALALGPAATIVAAGQVTGSDSFQRVAVLRLRADGSPDSSFGAGGVDVVDLGQDSVAKGAAVQADGRIVLAGSQGPGAHQILNAFVARLTASGALDKSFGTGPPGVFFQYPQGGGGAVTLNAVALDPAGAIVVAGGGSQTQGPQALFVRLTCAGKPDPSFAGGGQVLTPASRTFIGDPLGANGVAVGAGREIIGAGEFRDSGLSSAALWGLTSTGVPGFTTIAPSAGAQASALALDSAGNLVVAGTFSPPGSSSSGFVARYIGSGPPGAGGSPCGGLAAPPSVTPGPAAAIISDLTQSHRTWAETKSNKDKRPVGTTFSFSLNRSARVHFSFTQRERGRKVDRRCVAQTRRNRGHPTCQRTVGKGTIDFSGHAGLNRRSFKGRISRSRALAPGRYTVVITAVGAGVRRGKPQSLTFTIVR